MTSAWAGNLPIGSIELLFLSRSPARAKLRVRSSLLSPKRPGEFGLVIEASRPTLLLGKDRCSGKGCNFVRKFPMKVRTGRSRARASAPSACPQGDGDLCAAVRESDNKLAMYIECRDLAVIRPRQTPTRYVAPAVTRTAPCDRNWMGRTRRYIYRYYRPISVLRDDDTEAFIARGRERRAHDARRNCRTAYWILIARAHDYSYISRYLARVIVSNAARCATFTTEITRSVKKALFTA